MPIKLGRNDKCHCGSGKKYKKCCLATDQASSPATDQASSPVRKATGTTFEADIKEYIAFYLDECANDEDPILQYLVPNSDDWVEWRSHEITNEQVHYVIKLARDNGLTSFLEGWDDISEKFFFLG